MWFSALLCGLATAAAKPFEAQLVSSWHTGSDTAHALETVSRLNHTSYFPLLSLLLSQREKEGGILANEPDFIFDTALRTEMLQSSTYKLAKLEHELGISLPTLEAGYQLFTSVNDEARQCPVVMWNDGEYSCDRSDLYALQASNTKELPKVLDSDKVIGSGDQWIVLYADIMSPEFAEWHAVLLQMALEQKVMYVLRQRPASDEFSTRDQHSETPLAGYGVGVHVKRTDYLVIDDRLVDGELKLDLEAPKQQVPTSKISLLGFRAAHEVRELEGDGFAKLQLLADISHNFPDHASRLAIDANVEEAEAEAEANPGGGLGANGLFVNGIRLDATDILSVISTLEQEEALLRTLKDYFPNTTDIPRLLTSGVAHDSPEDDGISVAKFRYDLREDADAIAWVNDVESDVVFEKLPSDLGVLTSPSDSPFLGIRRNTHSVVVAGDLEDRRTVATIGYLMRVSGTNIPLQIGIVSPSPRWHRVAKLGLDARKAYISQLISGQSPEVAEAAALEAYEYAGNPVQTPISDSAPWLERFGIEVRGEPTVFVNGFPIRFDAWHEAAPYIFDGDAKSIRAMASEGSLTPSLEELGTDSLRDLLFASGAEKRNLLVDPVQVQIQAWPLNIPVQAFKNPGNSSSADVKHSVLISSSFETLESFDLVDNLLARSDEIGDVDVYVRPLSGVHEKFYNSIFDPQFNTFRFSRDLFAAAKGYLLQHKTAPGVFGAAKQTKITVDMLPTEVDMVHIDGRLVPLTAELPSVVDKILERETPRVKRLQKIVPGISGPAISILSAVAQERVIISDDDAPDLSIPGNGTSQVIIVADPASAPGQELIGVGQLAAEIGLGVEVYLSPTALFELPNRYYRGVLNRKVGAVFENLRDDVLYSVELVSPPAWVTRTQRCDYDLENIVLNTVKESKLEAVYSLRGLVIEGSVAGTNAPGARLDLVHPNGTLVGDTAVMANLGYFQLQAPVPGLYDICVADHHHSFLAAEGNTYDCLEVSVTDFRGTKQNANIDGRTPQHVARPTADAGTSSSGSIWKKLSGLGAKHEAAPMADINIFTVASGYLYERFASIMMLSVMEHTKHSVKFWMIDDFISPKFRAFSQELAKSAGFEIEFVSYKWPSWLRAQSEKQRIIWAYKMLFLDVLFPQNLSNIIFVDSDQIVRTDFMDLLRIDLEGAPYAFTPMGDDREEMEPFRFWKQGYWKRVLLDKGLKYHISALYRVDLDTFRQNKIGDLLRQQYQRLSADPQSLSNLDQDLPNSLQPYIPIYSLPQEWLWCETWCSDEGLATARTIDLCNNPLTKEPKLDRARRQVKEWAVYDDKIDALRKEFEQKQLSERASQIQSKADSQSAASATLTVDPNGGKNKAGQDEHPNEHVFDDDDIEPHLEL